MKVYIIYSDFGQVLGVCTEDVYYRKYKSAWDCFEYELEEGKTKETPGKLDFEIFWDKYNQKKQKHMAVSVWNKMSERQQQLAIDSVDLYRKDANEKYMVRPYRFLKNKIYLDYDKTYNKQESKVIMSAEDFIDKQLNEE